MIKWHQFEKPITEKEFQNFINNLPLDVDYIPDDYQGIIVGCTTNHKTIKHIFLHDPSDSYWVILQDTKGKFYEKGFDIIR